MNSDPSSSPCHIDFLYTLKTCGIDDESYLSPRDISVLRMGLLHEIHEYSEGDVSNPRCSNEVGLRMEVVMHGYLHKISREVCATR